MIVGQKDTGLIVRTGRLHVQTVQKTNSEDDTRSNVTTREVNSGADIIGIRMLNPGASRLR